MTIASLGLEVSSGSVTRGAAELDKLVSASAKAEAAAAKLGASSRSSAGDLSKVDTSASQAASGLTRLAAVSERAGNALDSISAGSMRASASVARLNVAANANERALVQVGGAAQNASHRIGQMAFQVNDIATMLAMGASPFQVMASQGGQIVQVYAGNGGASAALSDFATVLRTVAMRFAPVAVVAGAVALVIRDMQLDIEAATGKTYSFGEVARTAFGVVLDDVKAVASAIADDLQPAIDLISPALSAAWSAGTDAFVTFNNMLIGGWKTSYDAIVFGVNALPDAFRAAGEASANAFIGAIEQMVRETLVSINDLISDINGSLRQSGIDLQVPFAPSPMSFRIGRVDMGGNEAGQRLSDGWNRFSETARDNFNRDYTRDYLRTVRDRTATRLAGDGSLLPDTMEAPRLRGVDDIPERERARRSSGRREIDRAVSDAERSGLEWGKSLLTGIRDSLMNGGKDLGKVLLTAISNAFLEASNVFIEQIVKSLAGSLFGGGGAASSGSLGSTFTGLAQSVLGAATAGAANDNAVMRMPATSAAMSVYRDAIASIESAGSGGYAAIGPTNARMGRALGRYQIMEANIGPWSQEALGKTITPAQFLANPSYQDAIFDSKFGSYVNRFGPTGAAQAWFGGPGSVGKTGRSDVLGTTVGVYGEKFNAAVERLGGASQSATKAIDSMTTQAVDATKGLGSLGQQLSAAASSATGGGGGGGGGGGIFGWLSKLFGGGLGGAMGGALGPTSSFATGWVTRLHDGGLAGHGGVTIPVDPSVFIGAPRFHAGGVAGLAADEVPAILRRGEPVFQSMDHARAAVGGGGGPVTLQVVVNGARGNAEIQQMVREGANQAIGAYQEQQRRGGMDTDQRQYATMKR